ncbi:MICAL-like protein 2 [Halichondria panicea]|uniref:MICAL-like protein 2 n=1 Tax=Halichondria panicea TaxID=6063 RepID=UPI00312BA6BB
MARKTGLRGLQEWAKHVTQGYRDVEVTNMTTAFKSGLAFCAIIHRYHPELIPYDELRKENVLDNNQLAFSVAESELDIPALLDAEDMVSLAVPDKLSIATYLSLYYNYFKDKTPAKAGSQGVKTATTNETAPSPKRSKVEPIKKAMSSPSLKDKENTPFKTHPSSQINPPPLVKTSPTKPVASTAVHKGRKSKFNKANESEGGTLKRGTMGKEECEVCGERVFLLERLGVENRVFHRSCFKCSTCLVALKPGSYELHTETNKFYCQQHYREANRQATIKRTMAERGLSPSNDAPIKPKRSKKFKTKPEASTEIPPKQPDDKSIPSEVRAGLPSLLKTLATNKQQREATTASVVPPKEATTSVVPPKQATVSVVPPKQATASVVPPKQATASVVPPKQATASVVPPKQATASVVPPKQATASVLPPKQATASVLPPKQATVSVVPPKQTVVAKIQRNTIPTKPPSPVTNVTNLPARPQPPVTSTSKTDSEALTKPIQTIVTTRKIHEVKPTVTAASIPEVRPTASITPTKTVPKVIGAKTPQTIDPVKKTAVDPVKKTAVDPVKKTAVDPVKKTAVDPVKKTAVDPVKKTAVDPVKKTAAVDPVKKTAVDPVKKTAVDPVKKTALVGSGESVVPVKPPRKKKDEDVPVKRGSIKPKRPAPPRPVNPPHRGQPEQVRGGELLVEKRKRRVATLKRELDHVEREQERLEERGVVLEQQLRQKEEEADDTLMEEWFGLVNDKSMLVRTESDLVYELKDLELVEQHEALDIEIRTRLAKPDSLKSAVERLEEEAMISELVELVEKRDKLLWTLHFEKTQDDESDRQVELMTSTQVPSKLNKSMSFM